MVRMVAFPSSCERVDLGVQRHSGTAEGGGHELAVNRDTAYSSVKVDREVLYAEQTCTYSVGTDGVPIGGGLDNTKPLVGSTSGLYVSRNEILKVIRSVKCLPTADFFLTVVSTENLGADWSAVTTKSH